MALIPIRIDRTSKPPVGTPLRSDGHWSVQGLAGAWAFNEGAGNTVFDSVTGTVGAVTSGAGGAVTGLGVNFPGPSGVTPNFNDGILTGRKIPSAAFNITVSHAVSSENGGVVSIVSHGAGGPRAMMSGLSQLGLTVDQGGSAPASSFVAPRDTNKSSTLSYGYSNGLVTYGFNGQTEQVSWAPSFTFNNRIFCSGEYLDTTRYYGAPSKYYFLLWHTRMLLREEVSSLSNNPWQIYEPNTVWIDVGGGGEAALFAGSVYGQSFASAQLSTAITIASQVVAAGSIAGGINSAIRLATGAQGSASASALLTTAIRMAASAQGYGASTADLSTVIALAADILAASSASGALSTAIRFGGALSGSSTTTAALTNAITMAAQAAGLGSISGQLAGTVAAALFAGTISGNSSASANLSTAVVLAAAAQGSSTAQAALSTALELAAQVNGLGLADGALGSDISGLAGLLSGSSEAQATLATAIHLMGLASGQCGVVGRLAEPIEILAQLRVMASDPLALTISVRDPLALMVTVH